MGKTIVLESTKVDDKEFFDNWTDHYIEKCKDVEGVEDTEELRKLLNEVFRYGG